MTGRIVRSIRSFNSGYAMLPPLFGLVAGILLGGHTENPWAAVALLAVLTGALALYLPGLRFLLFVPIGLLLASGGPRPHGLGIDEFIGRDIDVEGSVYRSPEKRERGSRIFLDADYVIADRNIEPAYGRVIIYTDSPAPGVSYGDRIRVIGVKLRPIENFKNPGGFDIEGFFSRQGVYATGFAGGHERIVSFGRDVSYSPVLYGLDGLRHSFGNFVRTGFRYPASEVLNALTIGEDGGIPGDLRAEFSKAGVAHVLSISGLHVGAVAVVFYLIFKWLLKRSEYLMLRFRVPRIAAALTILPLFFYVALAGFSTPSVRAFIMISLFLLAIMAGRSENKINTLGAAAFIILLWRPPALSELSFQLSFAAVLGILLTNKYYPLKLGTTKDKFITLVKTTCAATFATLPLLINSFGVLPVISIPANLLFVPPVELLVVPLGIISFLAYLISPYAASLFIGINIHLLEMMIFGIGLLLEIPYSSLTVPPLGPLSLALFTALASTALLAARRPRLVYILPVLAAGLILSSAYPVLSRYLDRNMTVSFLDTGVKRSAVFAALPRGRTVLVTGGHSGSAAGSFIDQAVIGRFLETSGVGSIDCLILTSADKNNLNGARYLIENFDVKKIATNGDKLDGGLWEAIYSHGLQWLDLREIESVEVSDDFSVGVYKPEDGFEIEDSSLPYPVVLKITLGETSYLLGEALDQYNAGEELIERYGSALRGSVLFIPGLAADEASLRFIEYVGPEVLVTDSPVSGSGATVPPPSLRVYATGKQGAVTIYTDGRDMTIKTYTGEPPVHLR